MDIIARIYNDYTDKFGIPRQGRLADKVESRIEFEKEYRNPDAIRGMEGFSHLWLIWEFSENKDAGWSPTVRPPRLGGNKRMGVFATRSPFRPNPIGLSCVKIERIDLECKNAPVIYVTGADILNGTPIYDIKPYLAYTDSVPDASGGFAEEFTDFKIDVICDEKYLAVIPEDKRPGLMQILSQDPRPAYQQDDSRIYGFLYGDYEIKFTVKDNILTVTNITKQPVW